MTYYMGDYYRGVRGDYYRGDPGFLSVLGGIAKTIGGFIPGVGPIISGIGGAIEKAGTKSIAPAATSAIVKAVPPGGMVRGVASRVGSVIQKHPVLTGAGAAGLAGAAVGAGATRLLSRGRGGGHHRRMRVTNPKALRRAIRRTHGFAKLAMKTIHLVHPKKKCSFGGFRKRRKR